MKYFRPEEDPERFIKEAMLDDDVGHRLAAIGNLTLLKDQVEIEKIIGSLTLALTDRHGAVQGFAVHAINECLQGQTDSRLLAMALSGITRLLQESKDAAALSSVLIVVSRMSPLDEGSISAIRKLTTHKDAQLRQFAEAVLNRIDSKSSKDPDSKRPQFFGNN